MLNLFALIQIALECADAEKGYMLLNDNTALLILGFRLRKHTIPRKALSRMNLQRS